MLSGRTLRIIIDGGDSFQSLSPGHNDDQLLRTWIYIWNAWKGLHLKWHRCDQDPSYRNLLSFLFFYGNPWVKRILQDFSRPWKEELHLWYCHPLNMYSVPLRGLPPQPPQNWAFLSLPGVVCVPAVSQGSILVSPYSNAISHEFPDYWSLHGPNLFYVCLWESCSHVCVLACGVKSQLSGPSFWFWRQGPLLNLEPND